MTVDALMAANPKVDPQRMPDWSGLEHTLAVAGKSFERTRVEWVNGLSLFVWQRLVDGVAPIGIRAKCRQVSIRKVWHGLERKTQHGRQSR